MSRVGHALGGAAGQAKGRLTDVGFAVGWTALRRLPEPVVRGGFDQVAAALTRRRTKGVQRLRANLRRVLGPDASEAELDATVRAGMRSYMRYWAEVFRLPELGRDRIVGRTRWTGFDALLDAYRSGTGAVVSLPHMGNWDHAGAWASMLGLPFTTVAERLEPESVFDRFVEFRESLGMEVIPLTGGQQPPFHTLAQRLRAGGCVVLLGDRDLTSSGVPVQFFGEEARMPAGPASLALMTGAPLFPATLWYPDGRDGPDGPDWEIHVHPPVPVPTGTGRRTAIAAMTQSVATVFEEGIRDHPQDWHMLQRVWVADLDPEVMARRLTTAFTTEGAAAETAAGDDAAAEPADGHAAAEPPRQSHADDGTGVRVAPVFGAGTEEPIEPPIEAAVDQPAAEHADERDEDDAGSAVGAAGVP